MNTVRVVSPPALIENARSIQYANRASLDARFLREKIKADSRKRVKLRNKQNPNNIDKAGGKLEFETQKTYKLWRRRRTYLPPGYFIGPQGSYDAQGRLAVETTDDKQKFTVPNPFIPLIPHPDPNPNGLGPLDFNKTFLIQGGKLTALPRLLVWRQPGLYESQYELSAFLDYRTSEEDPVEFDSYDCTIEAFIFLPSSVARSSNVTALPSSAEYSYGFQVTSYRSSIGLSAPHFYSFFSNDVGTQDIKSLFPSNASSAVSDLYTGITGTGSTWNLYIRSVTLSGWATSSVPVGPGGSEVHVALTYSNNKINAYVAGQLAAQVPHYPTYTLDPMLNASMFAANHITNFFLIGNVIRGSYFSRPYMDVPFRLSRIRLTLDSIYSGTSFTPPSNIIGLF